MKLEYTFRETRKYASGLTGVIEVPAGTKGHLVKVVNVYETADGKTVVNIMVKAEGYAKPFSIYYVKGSEYDQFKDAEFLYPLDEKVIRDGEEYALYGYKTADGKSVFPRYCGDCKDGMWSGHVIDDGASYMCGSCMAKKYDDETMENMYQNDEQYYTEWDESELEEDGKYLIVEYC